MPPRPRLKPYFRPLRRGPDSVQLGLTGECGGVVLTGLSEAEMLLLGRLDGSITQTAWCAAAAAAGVSQDRAQRLLDMLAEHRLLVTDPADRAHLAQLPAEVRQTLAADADVLGLAYETPRDGYQRILERRRHHVLVGGSGPLPWAIASLLRSAGTGRVELGSWAVDLHDLALRTGTAPRSDETVPAPDLVILVAQGVLDPRLGEPWQRRAVPHLPVVSDGHRVLIGPLAGHAEELPCLRCLDMYRTDRDAAWPAVMAQLCPETGAAARPVSSESTLVCTAAGLVAMVAHTFLAGEAVPGGVSLEVAMPWPRLEHRRWHRHPACAGHAGAPWRPEPAPTRATMAE